MSAVQSDAVANDDRISGKTTDDDDDRVGEGCRASSTAPLAPPDGLVVHDGEVELTISDRRTMGGDGRSGRTGITTATAATDGELLDEVKRFELFRSVIQHEDDLLNQRVSWIILAQSFLVAAFITNASNDGSGDAMKLIAAVVGLSTVIVTTPAILAAGRNIELQQRVYFSGIISEERCFALHGHGRGVGKMGDRRVSMEEEQRKRISEGHIFPNMSFRGKGTVPILFTVVGLSIVQVLGWVFLLIALLRDW